MRVIKRALWWLVLLVFVAAIFVLVTYRGIAYDSFKALRYQPTPELSAVVDGAHFTWLGKVYFYGSEPVFDHSNRASVACGGVEKNSAILGCYANNTIYIYDVDSPELDGVEEVTAAHEMLHVAYARLPKADKIAVNDLLTKQKLAMRGDNKFAERMSVYDSLEQSDRLNELHSIIATEVASISDELERYYDQYFDDRDRVVALHKNYYSVFSELEKTLNHNIKLYNRQIADRNKLVQSMNERYEQLENEVESANTRKNVTTEEFAQISARIDLYNRDLSTVRSQVSTSDKSLERLRLKIENSVAMQEKYNQEIDSSLAPAPQL